MGSGKARLAVQTEVDIPVNQYYCLKRRYLAAELTKTLEECPRRGQPPKVTAALVAKITSLTYSEAGAACWTISLLSETLVTLAYEPAISDETIRKALKRPTQTLFDANVAHRYLHEQVLLANPEDVLDLFVQPVVAGVTRQRQYIKTNGPASYSTTC